MAYSVSGLLNNYQTEIGVVTVRNLDHHPLYANAVRAIMTGLRNINTSPEKFRLLTKHFYLLFVFPEFLQWLPHENVNIITGNSAPYNGTTFTPVQILADDIPRAGTDPMTRFMDVIQELAYAMTVGINVHRGVVDVKRIEGEGDVVHDVGRVVIPQLAGDVYTVILDPMLATGRSLTWTIKRTDDNLRNSGGRISRLFIGSHIATPEGIEHVTGHLNDNDISTLLVAGAVDPELDDRKYIVPGYGDAGDRQFNT